MQCEACGGLLKEVDRWDGERAFTLYQCQNCKATGGTASGDGLPEASWGVCGRKIVADGGTKGEDGGSR